MPKFFKKDQSDKLKFPQIDEIAYNAQQLKDSRIVRVFKLDELDALLQQVQQHFQFLESRGEQISTIYYTQRSAHYKRLKESLIAIRNDLVQTLTFLKLHADELEQKGGETETLQESFRRGNLLVKKLNGGNYKGVYEAGLIERIGKMEFNDSFPSES